MTDIQNNINGGSLFGRGGMTHPSPAAGVQKGTDDRYCILVGMPSSAVHLANGCRCVGRSSEWGVMPAHWYFSSALPRALLGALPLVLVGATLEHRVRPAAFIALAFVALYSFLPHKEVAC